MIYYLLGSSIAKSINPYCRKHILSSLEAEEFMFMNSFFITFFLIIYFIYLTITISNKHIDLYNKYTNLSYTQVFAAIIFSGITLLTTYFIINVDKSYGDPYTNSLIVKVFTTIIVVVVGFYIFEEKFTWSKIIGIIILLTGLYLLNE